MKQGEDLKTIVESCQLNMVDLNKFVAKCEKMAGDSYSTTSGRVSKNRSWWAKAWAKLKFVWTDKADLFGTSWPFLRRALISS